LRFGVPVIKIEVSACGSHFPYDFD
jgi:hypothetical protein